MLKELLSKLGADTKTTIGLSISPGVGLEMIEIDSATKMVNRYACREFSYNYSTREIENIEAFKEAFLDMLDELKIPKKCNVVLNLPNVHFGTISLPLLLTDDAVTNAIISETEKSYIFKRQEPVVSWLEMSSNIDTENRELIYSAIQQSTLDGINGVFEEVGCKLIAVETAFASLLKTLYFTGLAEEQMKDNVTWNLLMIGQNSYSILSMVGKKIIEYYEEPLALKSFSGDEIYSAIVSSAQITLGTLPANYLIIVSETDLVSAEVLSLKLPFEGQIKFVECNKYAQSEIMPANLNILPNVAMKISPEAIGAGIYKYTDFPIKFNLIGTKDVAGAEVFAGDAPHITIGGTEIELTPDFVKKVALLGGAAILVPALILLAILAPLTNKKQEELQEIEQKIEQLKVDENKLEGKNSGNIFDLQGTISNIVKSDRSKLMYYSVIGMAAPNKLCLNYFLASGEKGIDMKGQATDVESIYNFYKGVKQMVVDSDVRLYKLQIASDSIDNVVDSTGPKYYEFEITNMTDAELNPPAPTTEGKPADAAAQPEQQKGGLLPIKPLFGSKSQNNAAQPAENGSTPPAAGGNNGLPPNLEEIKKF